MDVLKLDLKTVKAAYVLLAILIGLAGVVSHFLGHDYVALGFIVVAAMVILTGSFLVSMIFRVQQKDKFGKL
jgi:multisubunit Na+/H+ antiporter MnhG subunit